MLEYCWLFALLLRSARYFPGAEGKWIPLPPMLPPSSLPQFGFNFLSRLVFHYFEPFVTTRHVLGHFVYYISITVCFFFLLPRMNSFFLHIKIFGVVTSSRHSSQPVLDVIFDTSLKYCRCIVNIC